MDRATQLREDALRYFCEKARAKYDKGQQEHGGYLVDRVTMDDIEEELIDLLFYFFALKRKLNLLSMPGHVGPRDTDTAE
tara:strand:- start:14501 stop:14740 length:240 start_codon:yes stop_codon:yes gene_type:complete